MNTPLISIIVPIYKVEKYLDRCIQSIMDQTYENLEIILVDDGSPDNCPSMCDAWAEKDSRIKVIHKENGGLSDARNAGMANASGDYIAFVDSDDWVSSQYLMDLYDALVKANADVAACDVLEVWDEENVQAEREKKTENRICNPEEAIEDIVCGKGFRAVAWNKLYKRKLLIGEHYPVAKHHEDEFFTYRILGKASKLVYVEEQLYYYVQRSGSIMRSRSMKRLDVLDAYLERLAYLQEHFPRLYVKDKVNFCVSCVCFYRQFQMTDGEEAALCKAKISQSRKKVRFSYRELHGCSKKQLLYIFCSRYAIGLFGRILDYRERGVICG